MLGKIKIDIWMIYVFYKVFFFMVVWEGSKDYNLIMVFCYFIYYEYVSEWNEIFFR